MKRQIIELIIRVGLIIIENVLIPLLNGMLKDEDIDNG